MTTELTNWALPRLSRLLPIDEASLKEIIIYSASLSKPAAAEHLKNLLGDSAPALEFISSLNSRRAEAPTAKGNQGDDAVLPHKSTGPKRRKAPLHSPGPVRIPEGYGNVAGGYSKVVAVENYAVPVRKETPPPETLSNAPALVPELDTIRRTRSPHRDYSPSPASSRDPSPPRQKVPSTSNTLISNMPNVRTKQFKKSPHSGSASPRKATTASTGNIDDLTAAITALEVTNRTTLNDRRKCDCNASLHPLFTTAPNCLNCGKIICSFEGLQPCSFCDSPILTKDQVDSMIKALREERGQELIAAHNASVSRSGRGTPASIGLGGNTPESSGDEAAEAAARARAHRDRLLGFQRENTQRTRIHDEAADYEITLTPGASQWMSPVQRAAALKKQQKYLRELEEQSKPEWEKKKTVMSMSIKGGKLVKTYESAKTPSAVPSSTDAQGGHEGELDLVPGSELQAGVGRNPLLDGGDLIRPIWKAPEGNKGKERAGNDGNSVWRRVQDDGENNEQWILDGGLHGFQGREDGSKQEGG